MDLAGAGTRLTLNRSTLNAARDLRKSKCGAAGKGLTENKMKQRFDFIENRMWENLGLLLI
jgi:hypothetical protein